MEPREWDIFSLAEQDGKSQSYRFNGTYAEACQQAREVHTETGRPASVWWRLTWYFNVSRYGERDWSKNAFAA